jgi:uncharacterized protein YneF (UPF0154 family)
MMSAVAATDIAQAIVIGAFLWVGVSIVVGMMVGVFISRMNRW